MESRREPLGTPDETISVQDINCWGTLPSAPNSLQSSLKLDDSVDSTVIRNTIVTESLIIHELDNRLLDAVCLDAEDNSVPSLERSLDTLSDKGDVSEQGPSEEDWSGKVDHAEEIKVAKHFSVDRELNGKIALWCGNIARVKADGSVTSCVEMLREKQPSQTRELLKLGGTELQRDVFNTYRCVTGDTALFRNSLLPIRHIIITAGPKYNPKYISAAENTLFTCYRNSLNLAMDYNVETLTIGKIHNEHKGYPEKEAVHMALRVTRRFLEKHGDRFRRICFVLESSRDMMFYQELFPYYFPRNSGDYKFQLELPDCMGGDYGEPIREGTNTSLIKAHWSTSSTPLAKKLNVHRSDFAAMKQDPDSARLFQQSQQPDVYNQLLQWSRTEDLSRVAKCRAVYHSGVDREGVPVVVCVGRHFPTHLPEHKVLSHCIQVMDPTTTRPYNLVYFHTTCTGPRKDLDLIQKVFSNSPLRYRTNLKALYSVHASRLQKFMTWWFTVSKVKEVKGKIVQFNSLAQLFEKFSPEQLQVPQFILDYDYGTRGSPAPDL
ncbi:ganglioside-induced differentiation-associated-protein 2-like isoform X2 [Bolinopsis microptera]|uniref:ganglioside-induced differentiation-associated-protein 2-like isoform X2 n=1 Tax=Bolinopsis microptera TaxID=2820187 RepID=UPI00307A3900